MDLATVRQRCATVLRALGYFSGMLAWLWVAIIVLPPLIDSGRLDILLPQEPTSHDQPRSVPRSSGLSPIVGLTVGMITLVMVVVSIIILWRLPRTVTKQGDKLVERTTTTILPVVTHHKKLPANQRRVLSRRLGLAVQVILVMIPFVAVWMFPAPEGLNTSITTKTGAVLSGAGLIAFVLAYMVDVPKRRATSRTRSRVSRGSR